MAMEASFRFIEIQLAAPIAMPRLTTPLHSTTPTNLAIGRHLAFAAGGTGQGITIDDGIF